MNDGQIKQEQYPQNTWQLIKYIAKRIPGRLLKALPMTIAFGVGSWLLHTFLLVYTNEGFNPDTWLGKNILNVSNKLLSSTLLWTMVGAIIPMFISFIRRKGNPVKAATAIVKLPVDIAKTNKESGGKFLPIMCFACAAALFIDGILSGVTSLVLGGIVMSSVVAFISGRGSIFIQILRMIFQDIQMFILKKKQYGLNNNNILMIIGVSGSTFFIFGIIKTLFTQNDTILNILKYLWILILILGIVLIFTKNKIPKQYMFLFGLIGMTAIMAALTTLKIYADDGGWYEAGGTFSDWIASEGSGQAIAMGLPPSIGGLIGSYVSSILSGLMSGFTPPSIDIPIGSTVTPTDPLINMPPTTEPQTPTTGTQTGTTEPQTNTPDPKEQERLKQQEQERLKEQERLRKEQEAKQKEFERLRQEKIREQEEIKRRAQEQLKLIEEEKKRKQELIDRLCKKYNCPPDKLKETLQKNRDASAAEAAEWNKKADTYGMLEKAAKVTLVAADTAIDGLANATGPLGKGIRAGYKITKGVATAAAEEGSLSGKAIATGLVKGGADAATDYMKSNVAKGVTTFVGEVGGGYIDKGAAGAIDGAKGAAINIITGTVTDKITSKMGGGDYGNMMDPIKFNKDGTATITMLSDTTGKWINKTVSKGSIAIKFADNKIKRQLISSAGKGTNGLITELGIKPALENN